MNDTLREVLENKDQVILGLQLQVQKQKKALDTNIQLHQKKKDPVKQQKINLLKQQCEQKQKLYEDKHAELATQKSEYHYQKDVQSQLEIKKMNYQNRLEKHFADLEDQDFLETKINSSLQSIRGLQEQQKEIKRMIVKKQQSSQVNGNQNEQDKAISQIYKINEYERRSADIENQLKQSNYKLQKFIQDCIRLQALNNIIKDKLIYTLGRQKGSSYGTICYFIRQFINDCKLNELLQSLQVQTSQNQEYNQILREQLQKISDKAINEVSDFDLQKGNEVNCEIDNWILVLQSEMNENEQQFTKLQQLIINMHDGVRIKCTKEISERLKIALTENNEGLDRMEKIEETITKCDKEIERLMKMSRLQYRKDDFKNLKKVLESIKDNSNELSSNFSIMKLVLDKSRTSAQNSNKLNITKAQKILDQIRSFEQSIYHDFINLIELEKKVKDLQVSFSNLIKQISQETHEHLVNQLNQRTKKAQELQQKDKELLNLIEGRKSDLFNIKNQIDENDSELQNIFATNQMNLEDAGGDEEQVSEQQKQIFNKTDSLLKQFKQIEQMDVQAFDQANDLLEQLDEMDSFIMGTELKIEEGFQKAYDLEENLKEMEKKLRNQRINESEKQIKLTFEQLEQLSKVLEKLNTQLSVIQKDQNQLLNNDQFQDQEKRREISSFGIELSKKDQQLISFQEAKEHIRQQIMGLEKEFQQSLREQKSNDGQEYVKIKKEAEAIREQIVNQISIVNEEFSDEITLCKEVNSKMVKKYKVKKDTYNQCMDLRKHKHEEFKEWQTKINTFNEKYTSLENSLATFMGNQTNDYSGIIQKFMNQIERNKQQSNSIDKQISHFIKRMNEEDGDLDIIDQKVVKTIKLEDIYKLLQEVKITCEPFDELIEKLQLSLRQIEKEIEAFMIKTRNSQLFDCENLMKKINDLVLKLALKIEEVNNEFKVFNNEVNDFQQTFQNKEALQQQLGTLSQELDQSDIQKDNLKQHLESFKTQLSILDKKNLNVGECQKIMEECVQLESNCNREYKQVVNLQEKLRKLAVQFRTQSENEQERQRLIAQAKIKLRDNQTLMKEMKTLLVENNKKVEDFKMIYNTMHSSDDYFTKKHTIEKKLRRMSQIQSDCAKYQRSKEQFEQDPTIDNMTEEQLENIQSLEELQQLIQKNEQVHQVLKSDVKELGEMQTSFEKRRRKIADAEIRQIANKRIQELEQVRDTLVVQMNNLNQFEEQLIERQMDQTNVLSPEKQGHLQKTLNELKSQFQEFKEQFDRVESEIKEINQDIAQKNLEREEPLPQLAKEIERLKKQTFEIKDLKFELDKIQIELQAKSTMLSSMDTEKKLKQLIQEVDASKKDGDSILQALMKVKDISNAYTEGGYTSGNEDEEFFSVVNSESRDLLGDFNIQVKAFDDIENDVHKLMDVVEQKKSQSGGNLQGDDVEDLNEQIGRIEGKLSKLKKQREDVEIAVMGNKEKLGQHDVDQKLSRRHNEIEELEKIIADINNDNNGIRDKIINEINACQGNPRFEQYVERLNKILENTQIIEEKATKIHQAEIDIDFDVDQAINDLNSNCNDTNQRLDSLEANLTLKSKIQNTLKQISSLHTLVKQVFSQTNDTFAKKPQEIVYKPVVGDDIDKMLGEILNRLGINIPIKRLGNGYYLFGTKKIYCKIINGKLVVRVGGGYMGIEEFITQYGQQELDKLNAQANVEAQLKEAAASNSKKGSQVKLPIFRPTSTKDLGSPKTLRSQDDSISGKGAYTTIGRAGHKSNFSQLSDSQKHGGGGGGGSSLSLKKAIGQLKKQ